MMSIKNIYAWLLGAGILGLVLFVLVDPQSDDEEKAYLWDESWAAIAYLPGEAAKEKSKIKFYRNQGLFQDELIVEAAVGEKPDAPLVSRRANATVKNIFRDWGRPEMKAVYKLEPAKREELGFSKEQGELHFYTDANAEPAILRMGNATKGGNRYVTSTYEDQSDLVFMIPSHIFNKLIHSYTSYREKRILSYPTDSYAKEVEVMYRDGKETKHFRIFQTREQKGEKTVEHWMDESGYEYPANLVRPLESHCKNLQIRYFNDDPKVSDFGAIQDLWQKAEKDFLTITVKLDMGKTSAFRVRKPAKPVKVGRDRLFLLQSSLGSEIDFAQANHAENVNNQVRRLLRSKALELKKKAAQKQKAEAKAKEGQSEKTPGAADKTGSSN